MAGLDERLLRFCRSRPMVSMSSVVTQQYVLCLLMLGRLETEVGYMSRGAIRSFDYAGISRISHDALSPDSLLVRRWELVSGSRPAQIFCYRGALIATR